MLSNLKVNQKTKKFFESFDIDGDPVMLKECNVVVEDLLSDTQERSNIHNEDQNNINKDNEFIAKKFEETSELSNVRHTEKKRERTSK